MSEDFGTTPPPPPQYIPPAAAPGLSDNAAAALSYITFIPALIFLLIAPYNQKPFVKFNAIQELGLTVTMIALHFIAIIPILGWIAYIVGALGCFVLWVICIIKASQGSVFKLPLIGDFAAQQSGYAV
jgi:uncharacterized membrane protein